jgi:hypothetical protein
MHAISAPIPSFLLRIRPKVNQKTEANPWPILNSERMHLQIRDLRIEHWGMNSLQSDFKRHSLTNLLGAAEIRMIIFSYTSVVLCHPQPDPVDPTVLNQSSRPTSSDPLQVWLGKAKSSDVALSIPRCSIFPVLTLLCHHGFGNGYTTKGRLGFYVGVLYKGESRRTS